MASGGAPLATHDEAVDKKQDDSTDHATKEACGFPRFVPSDGLPEVGRNERAHDPQNGCQNKALRFGLVARHDELGNDSNDKTNNDRPNDAHSRCSCPEQVFGTMDILREVASEGI